MAGRSRTGKDPSDVRRIADRMRRNPKRRRRNSVSSAFFAPRVNDMPELVRFCPPPVLALLLVSGAFGLNLVLPILSGLALPETGALLGGVGAILAASSLWLFRQRDTTFMPRGEPRVLVTEGPFQWTRNPMYLGWLVILLGVALFVGGLIMLAPPVLFVMAMERLYIAEEEKILEGLFGSRFASYRLKVPRWI